MEATNKLAFFFKFQLYSANVFNFNIMAEMPEELSTFDSAQASFTISQSGNGGGGPCSSCCRPQATEEVTHRGTEREGSCPYLSWVSGSHCFLSSCNRVYAVADTRSPCLTKQFKRCSVTATLAWGKRDHIYSDLVPFHMGQESSGSPDQVTTDILTSKNVQKKSHRWNFKISDSINLTERRHCQHEVPNVSVSPLEKMTYEKVHHI